MDQDATWYGGRPRPGDIVLHGDPAPTEKGTAALHFSAYVYCGERAGCIRIPLGMEVSLGPGDIVLDGVPAPPRRDKGHVQQPLTFRPMSIVVKRLDGPGYHLVWR